MSDDKFWLKCEEVWQSDRNYRSVWKNVSEEGITTTVIFEYFDMDGCGDEPGMEICVTLHDVL